ncbi:MAG: TRAP transporter substrate-binding protein [Thermodesulfobacteriota bacterium]
MFKRSSWVLMVLAISVFVCGFGAQELQAADPKPIELRFAHTNPPGTAPDLAAKEWIKLVEQKAKGRLKITIYPASTLAKITDEYDGIVNGVIDLGWNTSTPNAARFPMLQVTTLPMVGIPSSAVGSKALNELYRTTDYLKKEFSDTKVLFFHTETGNTNFGSTKKPIRTLEDLKGLKVRAAPGSQTEFLKSVGALPVPIPITEAYESIERGVLEGYIFAWAAVKAFRLHEVTKYFTTVRFYTASFWAVMNQKVFANLPADARKAIDECSGDVGAEIYSRHMTKDEEMGLETVKKMKKEIYSLPPEEEKRWAEVAMKTWETWVADQSKQNRPAREVLDTYRKLLAEAKKK